MARYAQASQAGDPVRSDFRDDTPCSSLSRRPFRERRVVRCHRSTLAGNVRDRRIASADPSSQPPPRGVVFEGCPEPGSFRNPVVHSLSVILGNHTILGYPPYNDSAGQAVPPPEVLSDEVV